MDAYTSPYPIVVFHFMPGASRFAPPGVRGGNSYSNSASEPASGSTCRERVMVVRQGGEGVMITRKRG